METWADRIEGLVREGPTGAVPFSRILHALEGEGVAVQGREAWFFQRLQERKDRFRIVPDRFGPWLRWPATSSLQVGSPFLAGGQGDPWIIPVKGDTPPPMGAGEFLAGRMKETLRAWGLQLDDSSQVSVARWIGANGEAEKVLNILVRRSPPGT